MYFVMRNYTNNNIINYNAVHKLNTFKNKNNLWSVKTK